MCTSLINEISTKVYAISTNNDLNLRACITDDPNNKIKFLTEKEITDNFYEKIMDIHPFKVFSELASIRDKIDPTIEPVVIEIVHITKTIVTKQEYDYE